MDGAHRLGEPIIGMRPAIALLAVFMVVGMGVAMKIGARNVITNELPSMEDGQDLATPPAPAGQAEDAPKETAVQQEPGASQGQPGPADRPLDPPLERVGPREPLSELGLALPPKPPSGNTILYRPIATSSSRFEAMDRVIAIGGVEEVPVDERCSYQGNDWDCGMYARTAFRSFIRGRAITCDLPPEAPKETVVDGCHIGTQDVGAWLVANGWARAAPDGPYVDAGKQALEAGRGIFGPRPKASNELN